MAEITPIEKRIEPIRLRPHHIERIFFIWPFMSKADIEKLHRELGYEEQHIFNLIAVYNQVILQGNPIEIILGTDDICERCNKLLGCDTFSAELEDNSYINNPHSGKYRAKDWAYVPFFSFGDTEPLVLSPLSIIDLIISGLEKKICKYIVEFGVGDKQKLMNKYPILAEGILNRISVYESLREHLKYRSTQ